MAVTPTGLLEVALFIGIYSIALYKESPLYRICEHMYVGTMMGFAFINILKAISSTAITPLMNEGKIIYIIPIVLGLSVYLRYSKQTMWASRIPMAIIIGVGLAIGLRGFASVYILESLKAVMYSSINTGNALTNINNIFMVVVTFLVLAYFIFTVKQGNEGSSMMFNVRKISRILIMILLGVYFANIVMVRFGQVSGLVREVLVDLGFLPF